MRGVNENETDDRGTSENINSRVANVKNLERTRPQKERTRPQKERTRPQKERRTAKGKTYRKRCNRVQGGVVGRGSDRKKVIG